MKRIPKVTELDYLNTPVNDIVNKWLEADEWQESDRDEVTKLVESLIRHLQWEQNQN